MSVFSGLNPVKVKNISSTALGAGTAFIAFAFSGMLMPDIAPVAILALFILTAGNITWLALYPSPFSLTSFLVMFVLFIPAKFTFEHPLELVMIGFSLLCVAMLLYFIYIRIRPLPWENHQRRRTMGDT